MKDFFEVGIVTSTHGLKGEVKVFTTSEDPDRFDHLKEVFLLERDDQVQKLVIERVGFFKNQAIVKFKDKDHIEDAQRLCGRHLFIPRSEALPLHKNELYIPDLMGCRVYLEDDTFLGTLKDVLVTGAHDIYVVSRENAKDVLIPAIDVFIRQIDADADRMVVRLPDGLLD